MESSDKERLRRRDEVEPGRIDEGYEIHQEDGNPDDEDSRTSDQEYVWCCEDWLDLRDTQEHKQAQHPKLFLCEICNDTLGDEMEAWRHFKNAHCSRVKKKKYDKGSPRDRNEVRRRYECRRQAGKYVSRLNQEERKGVKTASTQKSFRHKKVLT